MVMSAEFNPTKDELINALQRDVAGVNSSGFPLALLPQGFQKMVLELSDANSLRLEYLAGSMLACVAPALGNAWKLRALPQWEVSPAFYMALVGAPGVGKTPPMNLAVKPLIERDNALLKEYQDELKKRQAAAS